MAISDGPLENLWGGEGAGEVQKKNSCTPINPKKYSCYGLKKIHTKNLITKKNSCGSKIPLPPHNFSNGPSLTGECQSGHMCKFAKDTIVIGTREVGEKIKT